MTPESVAWLDLACSHLSTKWLKQSLQSLLPSLVAGELSCKEFANQVEDCLHDRGLFTPAQQKNPRSNIVQALKSIDEQHPAIPLVGLTTEQFRDLNEEQRGRLAQRETQFFTSAIAEELVQRATALLESAEWSEVGAGLAVLIGRRISEILLSSFSLNSSWSLNFSEMAKKADGQGLTIEIPTLAPAPIVLNAINRLQKGLRIEDLKLNSLSPKMAKQTVNGRYSDPVAAKCVEHFSGLVPARSDRENLYTHIFRAVYASISAHWFCPPTVPEHNFKAEIQGHFTLTKDGKKLPNFSARANYDDYAIGTQDGNRDGRLGIKLGTLPGLEVIEAFRKTNSLELKMTETFSLPASIELNVETMRAFAARAVNLLTTHEPLDLAIALISLTGQFPQTFTEQRWQEASKFSLWLESEQWEIPTLTAANQVLSGVNKLATLAFPSQDACTALHVRSRGVFAGLVEIADLTDLQAIYTQIALYRFCPSTIQEAAFIEAIRATVSPQWSRANSERGTWLDQRYVEPLRCFQSQAAIQILSHSSLPTEESTMATPPAKLKTKRPEVYAEDWEEMVQLMVQRGITGSTGEFFHALIQAFKAGESEQQQHQVRTLSELTSSLTWFTDRIDHLEKTCKQLQQERDQLQQSQTEIDELAQLRNENAQLKQQLHQTQAQLQGIQKLLGMEANGAVAPSQVSVSTLTTPTHTSAAAAQSSSTDHTAPTISANEKPDTSIKPHPKEPTSEPATRRNRGETLNKIHQIIDGLISWNTSQEDPQTQLRISIPTIKGLASAMGANYQPAIQEVLKERATELDEHHSRLLIGTRHNAGVNNKDELLRAISRDYLGLENWQSVKYQG